MRRINTLFLIIILVGILPSTDAAFEKEKIWVKVGPNIRASADIKDAGRNECWIASSLEDPDFLVGISHAGRRERTCPIIVSKDGGQTWMDVALPGGNTGFDPLVLAGPGGIMYAMVCGLNKAAGENTNFWSTKDNGKTWQGPTEIYSFSLDHPRMVVDTTGGAFHGRIYYAWNEVSDSMEKGKFNIYLHYSDDEGKSFIGPKHLHKIENGKLVMADIVVLSDGTLIVPYYQYFWPLESKKNEQQPVWILTSEDGGNTFTGPHKVVNVGISAWVDVKKDFPSAFTLPIVTADISDDSPYRDRLYMVWDDCSRTGFSSIWLIWSGDKGQTWSDEIRVNDNSEISGKGPRDFRMTPVVAVNKDGIVAVAWYDRRDDPTRRCWDYFMAVSLDGGQTFEKNFKVSSVPSCPDKNIPPSIRIKNISPEPETDKNTDDNIKLKNEPKIPSIEIAFDKARNVWPGHYTGLTADLKGRFHALWADRRNPIQQLYTAVVEINRAELKSPELTDDLDITGMIQLIAGSADFNEKDGMTTFDLQVRNVSNSPIFGPLRVEVSRIEAGWNDIATTEIMNADNKKTGTGSIWDFTSSMGTEARLDPKGVTEAKKVKIKTFVEAGLDGKVEFRVFGRLLKKNKEN